VLLLLKHCAGRCCGCLQALLPLFLPQQQQLSQVLQVQAHNTNSSTQHKSLGALLILYSKRELCVVLQAGTSNVSS
jgi:hypothetical protein